jgi:hypothetical protein
MSAVRSGVAAAARSMVSKMAGELSVMGPAPDCTCGQ